MLPQKLRRLHCTCRALPAIPTPNVLVVGIPKQISLRLADRDYMVRWLVLLVFSTSFALISIKSDRYAGRAHLGYAVNVGLRPQKQV